jgi:hypothetical protein
VNQEHCHGRDERHGHELAFERTLSQAVRWAVSRARRAA